MVKHGVSIALPNYLQLYWYTPFCLVIRWLFEDCFHEWSSVKHQYQIINNNNNKTIWLKVAFKRQRCRSAVEWLTEKSVFPAWNRINPNPLAQKNIKKGTDGTEGLQGTWPIPRYPAKKRFFLKDQVVDFPWFPYSQNKPLTVIDPKCTRRILHQLWVPKVHQSDVRSPTFAVGLSNCGGVFVVSIFWLIWFNMFC